LGLELGLELVSELARVVAFAIFEYARIASGVISTDLVIVLSRGAKPAIAVGLNIGTDSCDLGEGFVPFC